MPIAFFGLGAALGYAAVAQGAFYGRQAVFFAGILTLAALAGARGAIRGAGVPMLGFGVLLGGLLTSTAANGWLPGWQAPAATLVAATGAFLAGRAVVRDGHRGRLFGVLAVIGAGLGVLGFLGVAYHVPPFGMRATGLWRAASTITYANGLAAVLLICLPAAALRVRHGTVPAALAAFAMLAGLLATASRAGLLALAAMAVATALAGGWTLLRAAARPMAGAVIALVGLLPSMVYARERPVLALVGLAAGAAVAAAPVSRLRPGIRRLAAVGALAVAAAVIVATFAMAGGRLPRFVESRVAAPEPRIESWRQTLEAGLSSPVTGIGPGRLGTSASLFAHNEYLQVFAETGMVGLGSVLLAVALFSAWAVRRRPRGPDRMVWAAAVAVAAAFLVHGSFDFVWHFPLVVAGAFLWLALATTVPLRSEREMS